MNNAAHIWIWMPRHSDEECDSRCKLVNTHICAVSAIQNGAIMMSSTFKWCANLGLGFFLPSSVCKLRYFPLSLSLSVSLSGRVGSWQAQSPTSLVTAGGGSLWALSQQWTHTLAQHTHSAACLVQPTLPLSEKMGKHRQWSPDVHEH